MRAGSGLARAPQARRSRRRARRGPVELAHRLGLGEPRVLGLEDDPPARRPARGLDADDDVAGLAGGALDVADGIAVVALHGRDRVDRLAHGLLVVAALGGAPVALLGQLELLLLLAAHRLQLPLKLGDPLAHRAEVRVLLLGGPVQGGERGLLEAGQGVAGVVGGQLAGEVLAQLRVGRTDDLVDAVVDSFGAALRKRRSNSLRQPVR